MELREGIKSSNYFHLFGLLPCLFLILQSMLAKAGNKVYIMYSEAQKDKIMQLNNTILSRAWTQRAGKVQSWLPNFCMHKIIDTTSQQSFICEMGQITCRVSQ